LVFSYVRLSLTPGDVFTANASAVGDAHRSADAIQGIDEVLSACPVSACPVSVGSRHFLIDNERKYSLRLRGASAVRVASHTI
jgi:hypothetical protein